jgi:SSS family solute:Na+ symporter
MLVEETCSWHIGYLSWRRTLGRFSIGLGGPGFMGISGSWMLFTGLLGAWLCSILIPKVSELGHKYKFLLSRKYLVISTTERWRF